MAVIEQVEDRQWQRSTADGGQASPRPRPSSRRASASPASGARREAFAARYGLEFVDLTRFRIDNDLFRRIPFDLMLRYGFIPRGAARRAPGGGHGRPVRRAEARRDRAAARPAGRGQGRRALGDRGDPAEVARAPSACSTRRPRTSASSSSRRTRRARRSSRSTASPPTPARSSSWSTRRSSTPSSAAPRDIHIETRDTRGGHQVPHRRRALPGDGADRQAPPPDDHQPHQGHVRARHRREAHPAGRPLQAARARAAPSTSASRSCRRSTARTASSASSTRSR